MPSYLPALSSGHPPTGPGLVPAFGSEPSAQPEMTDTVATAHRRSRWNPAAERWEELVPRATTVPDEVLGEIFGHLQTSYNTHRRENALQGILATSPSAWNPAGLQLVCHRWQDIARPLYYREQVAVDCANDDRTSQLVRTLVENPSVPYPRLFVLNVIKVASFRVAQLRIVGYGRQTESAQAPALAVLASVPCFEDGDAERVGHQLSHCSSYVVSLRGRMITGRAVYGLLHPLHPQLVVGLHDVGQSLSPGALTLRFAKEMDVAQVVAYVVDSLYEIAYLPSLRLEFPFSLPPSFVEGEAFRALIQDESLAAAASALWTKDQTRKRVSFGVVSAAEALWLRSKIETFEELAVSVEVDVL